MIGRLYDGIFLRMMQMPLPSSLPEGASDCARAAPAKQFFTPRGVPLYPVEIIRWSLTITAATCRREQLLLVATAHHLHKIGVPIWAGIDTHGAYVTRCAPERQV